MLKLFKKAFTLAEVLIVIGIIGVVAALTLPNLNHATGDKEKVTKVKKIYSTLNEAFDRALVIYGDFDTWGDGLSTDAEKSERFARRVTEFMKVSKDCGFESGCFSSSSFILPDGEIFNENYLESLQNGVPHYMLSLTDGISVGFLYFEEIVDGQKDSFSKIRADIDGPNKGKNQYGNDIFDFDIKEISNQFFIVPSSKNFNDCLIDADRIMDCVIGSGEGGNTTVWVIENGNLDYLKCLDELNWETKTSCE